MNAKIALIIVGILTSGSFPAKTAAGELFGIPRVIDGDTVVVAGVRVRLEAIDAPETDQVCLDEHGTRWTCGIEARHRLADHIGSRRITCTSNGRDAYARVLAVCYLDGENLNAWMVQQGWALAFVRFSTVYAADQMAARAEHRGLWRGAFIAPWDWRHRDRSTIILGATSLPIEAQDALLTPASAATAPSPECTIKGNINRRGERIYHVPGGLHYGAVNMASGPSKRWFCTTEEAEAAGWRRAR